MGYNNIIIAQSATYSVPHHGAMNTHYKRDPSVGKVQNAREKFSSGGRKEAALTAHQERSG